MMVTPEHIATKGIGPVLRYVIKFIPYAICSTANYVRRPKLKIAFRQQHFLFKDSENTQHAYCFPCVIMENPTSHEYKIEPGSIRINKETYAYCVQSNAIFNRCNEGTANDRKLVCLNTNNACSFIKEHWQSITQNSGPPLCLTAHEKILFPLFPSKENSHFIIQEFPDSKLWKLSSKISIRMKINSVESEYGLNRRLVYETVINWLAFWNCRDVT